MEKEWNVSDDDDIYLFLLFFTWAKVPAIFLLFREEGSGSVFYTVAFQLIWILFSMKKLISE